MSDKKTVGRPYKYGEKLKNVQSKIPLSRIAEFIELRDKFLAKKVKQQKILR